MILLGVLNVSWLVCFVLSTVIGLQMVGGLMKCFSKPGKFQKRRKNCSKLLCFFFVSSLVNCVKGWVHMLLKVFNCLNHDWFTCSYMRCHEIRLQALEIFRNTASVAKSLHCRKFLFRACMKFHNNWHSFLLCFRFVGCGSYLL